MDARVQRTIEKMEEQLLFRAATGTTPGAFLHELRMTRARILVERTSLPVNEVMVQVGLSDRSHFARDFRRAHGLGPRALRMHRRMAGAGGGGVPQCG